MEILGLKLCKTPRSRLVKSDEVEAVSRPDIRARCLIGGAREIRIFYGHASRRAERMSPARRREDRDEP